LEERKADIYVGNEEAWVVGHSIRGKREAAAIQRKHTLVLG
jgi:hypothetical protein